MAGMNVAFMHSGTFNLSSLARKSSKQSSNFTLNLINASLRDENEIKYNVSFRFSNNGVKTYFGVSRLIVTFLHPSPS